MFLDLVYVISSQFPVTVSRRNVLCGFVIEDGSVGLHSGYGGQFDAGRAGLIRVEVRYLLGGA